MESVKEHLIQINETIPGHSLKELELTRGAIRSLSHGWIHTCIRDGKICRILLIKKGDQLDNYFKAFKRLKECPLIYTFVTRYKGKFRLAFIISNLLTP